MQNIYLQLTAEFNHGRVRAIMCGGQAVVLHRLAIMSKDGDWILREDRETIGHVLAVLGRHGATYRFGAPLDLNWLSGGWSAHLEFMWQGLRVRTDFVTRPPRLSGERLARLWDRDGEGEQQFLGVLDLIETKKTNREKDYVVIGELARLLQVPGERLLNTLSAKELIELVGLHPDLAAELCRQRPLLAIACQGVDALEVALDAERRTLMHANERRLAHYLKAAESWARQWPDVFREMAGVGLAKAQEIMVGRAHAALPCTVPGGLG